MINNTKSIDEMTIGDVFHIEQLRLNMEKLRLPNTVRKADLVKASIEKQLEEAIFYGDHEDCNRLRLELDNVIEHPEQY